MKPLYHIDFFAGRGGFTRGLRRAGIKTIGHIENDPACIKGLKRLSPGTPILTDIENVGFWEYDYHDGALDDVTWNTGQAICFNSADDVIWTGGYPCTGHSVAGKKKGLKDEKSKLWKAWFKLIKAVRPKFIIIENSPNLRSTGLVEVLKDLRSCFYNVEGQIISGYSIGAPTQRERLYIVAWREDVPYCDPFRLWGTYSKKEKTKQEWGTGRRFKRDPVFKEVASFEPKILRKVDGLPEELLQNLEYEVKMIGNAIYPQVAEYIGRRLQEFQNGVL